jgi:hypothetical protein
VAQLTVVALWSLLRFLHLEGVLERSLAGGFARLSDRHGRLTRAETRATFGCFMWYLLCNRWLHVDTGG